MKYFPSLLLVSSLVFAGVVSAADNTAAAPTTITTLSGQTYREVEILKAYPNGLAFRHSKGVAQIIFEDLSPELQKQYGYDPAASKAYEKEHFEAERVAAEKAAAARAERRKRQEEARMNELQAAMLRQYTAAAGAGYPAGGYYDYGAPVWGYGYGADLAFPPVFGIGDDLKGRRHGSGRLSHADRLFYNYNTTSYIGPYSALYSGALTNSNVRSLLTFGGYSYPTALAVPANTSVVNAKRHRHDHHGRGMASGHGMRPGHGPGHGGIGHGVVRPRPVYVPANSAGARIGGTGGLMRVGSPRISHR